MSRAWGRLPDRSDFLRVAAHGIRQGTPAFLLQAAKSDGDGQMRIGFTASRKIGNAVIRNRAKRRLRAAADSALLGLHHNALDIVLVARHSATTRDFAALTSDMLGAAKRVISKLAASKPALGPAP